ncbi:hypothetical protein [Megasphaera sp. SW808]|uniref:hypothetical protein n=1 Tax=Megasphaera sp. SW808 TaxID=2530045 RepID=UPI00143C60D2|nr:hypothetical protein [Megasphaera sp. SW808]
MEEDMSKRPRPAGRPKKKRKLPHVSLRGGSGIRIISIAILAAVMAFLILKGV